MQLPVEEGRIDGGPTGPARAGSPQPVTPGFRQRRKQGQQLPQGGLIFRRQRHQMLGMPGLGQHPPPQPPMQGEQTRLRQRQGPAQTVPVSRLDAHGHGLPQQVLQELGLGNHQLAIPQGPLPPHLEQLPMAEKPEVGLRRRVGSLPAAQIHTRCPQPGPFPLQETQAQALPHHQGNRRARQAQGHQETDQPAGVTAGGQPDQGVVAPAQAAAHKPAEGEVVGPAL